MAVITRGGKQTSDPPILSGVEDEVRKDNEVVEDNGELMDKVVEKVKIPKRRSPS